MVIFQAPRDVSLASLDAPELRRRLEETIAEKDTAEEKLHKFAAKLVEQQRELQDEKRISGQLTQKLEELEVSRRKQWS